MKEMVLNGFDEVKVNLFDIETSEAMKQIADISNRSIMEQLTWDSNDYTEMIKEQREKLLMLQDENGELKEQNRILQNQIIDLQNKKKR